MSDFISCFPFCAGQVIGFQYPLNNRFCVSTRLHHRRLAIHKIRDLERNPLDPRTLKLNPHLRRSRYLILGHDLDKHRWRSFYDGSMRRELVIPEPTFRLAMYDPVIPDGTLRYFGYIFREEEIGGLYSLLQRMNNLLAERRQSAFSVGVFPWKP